MRGDRDPVHHVRSITREERPRERATRVSVVPVRHEVHVAALGVAATGTQLLGERITSPAAAPKAAPLDDLDELVDRERSRALERAASFAVEQARRCTSGHQEMPARRAGWTSCSCKASCAGGGESSGDTPATPRLPVYLRPPRGIAVPFPSGAARKFASSDAVV